MLNAYIYRATSMLSILICLRTEFLLRSNAHLLHILCMLSSAHIFFCELASAYNFPRFVKQILDLRLLHLTVKKLVGNLIAVYNSYLIDSFFHQCYIKFMLVTTVFL